MLRIHPQRLRPALHSDEAEADVRLVGGGWLCRRHCRTTEDLSHLKNFTAWVQETQGVSV